MVSVRVLRYLAVIGLGLRFGTPAEFSDTTSPLSENLPVRGRAAAEVRFQAADSKAGSEARGCIARLQYVKISLGRLERKQR